MHRIYSILHMTRTQNRIIAVKNRSNESYKELEDHESTDKIITKKIKIHSHNEDYSTLTFRICSSKRTLDKNIFLLDVKLCFYQKSDII